MTIGRVMRGEAARIDLRLAACEIATPAPDAVIPLLDDRTG